MLPIIIFHAEVFPHTKIVEQMYYPGINEASFYSWEDRPSDLTTTYTVAIWRRKKTEEEIKIDLYDFIDHE